MGQRCVLSVLRYAFCVGGRGGGGGGGGGGDGSGGGGGIGGVRGTVEPRSNGFQGTTKMYLL